MGMVAADKSASPGPAAAPDQTAGIDESRGGRSPWRNPPATHPARPSFRGVGEAADRSTR